MRVSKNAWNSHNFGQFFRRGRDAVSRFFESLQRTKIKIRCCTVLRVLQWLAGVYVERFYYFLTNLRVSNAYKTAFIEGGKVTLGNWNFSHTYACCTGCDFAALQHKPVARYTCAEENYFQ